MLSVAREILLNSVLSGKTTIKTKSKRHGRGEGLMESSGRNPLILMSSYWESVPDGPAYQAVCTRLACECLLTALAMKNMNSSAESLCIQPPEVWIVGTQSLHPLSSQQHPGTDISLFKTKEAHHEPPFFHRNARQAEQDLTAFQLCPWPQGRFPGEAQSENTKALKTKMCPFAKRRYATRLVSEETRKRFVLGGEEGARGGRRASMTDEAISEDNL